MLVPLTNRFTISLLFFIEKQSSSIGLIVSGLNDVLNDIYATRVFQHLQEYKKKLKVLRYQLNYAGTFQVARSKQIFAQKQHFFVYNKNTSQKSRLDCSNRPLIFISFSVDDVETIYSSDVQNIFEGVIGRICDYIQFYFGDNKVSIVIQLFFMYMYSQLNGCTYKRC